MHAGGRSDRGLDEEVLEVDGENSGPGGIDRVDPPAQAAACLCPVGKLDLVQRRTPISLRDARDAVSMVVPHGSVQIDRCRSGKETGRGDMTTELRVYG